jgi:hypothetical protein
MSESLTPPKYIIKKNEEDVMATLGEVKALLALTDDVHTNDTTRINYLRQAVKMLLGIIEGHRHSVHPADGDVSGPMIVPVSDLPGFVPGETSDPYACNCLGKGGACWRCYQGDHDRCTSDQHGRGSTRCSWGQIQADE